MKAQKIAYWIATGILCALMVFSATTYLVRHERVVAVFVHLGFPTWIIVPLAIAKLLGVAAILSKKSMALKEWAYAGFFYDFALAIGAHIAVGDGVQVAPAIAAMTALLASYALDRRLYPRAR